MKVYEKAKGTSYVGTNLSLSTVDPAAKVLKLAGVGFFGKIGKKVDKIGKILKISPYKLNKTPGNPLRGKDYLERLKNEIKANGNKINEPIRVHKFKGEYYILDGHHRTRVAKELGIKEVPIKEVKLPYGNYKTEQDLFY